MATLNTKLYMKYSISPAEGAAEGGRGSNDRQFNDREKGKCLCLSVEEKMIKAFGLFVGLSSVLFCWQYGLPRQLCCIYRNNLLKQQSFSALQFLSYIRWLENIEANNFKVV